MFIAATRSPPCGGGMKSHFAYFLDSSWRDLIKPHVDDHLQTYVSYLKFSIIASAEVGD